MEHKSISGLIGMKSYAILIASKSATEYFLILIRNPPTTTSGD
jgi:hypothetical protein